MINFFIGKEELAKIIKNIKNEHKGFQITWIFEGIDNEISKKNHLTKNIYEEYKMWMNLEFGCHVLETKNFRETCKMALRLIEVITKSLYRDLDNHSFNFCVDSVHTCKE